MDSWDCRVDRQEQRCGSLSKLSEVFAVAQTFISLGLTRPCNSTSCIQLLPDPLPLNNSLYSKEANNTIFSTLPHLSHSLAAFRSLKQHLQWQPLMAP